MRRKTSLALVVLMVAALHARADRLDDFVAEEMRAQQIALGVLRLYAAGL